MPHISVYIGEDTMPTPGSLGASAEFSRLLTREATDTSIGQNSTAMLTIVVGTEMLEPGLVASPANELSEHRQRISG